MRGARSWPINDQVKMLISCFKMVVPSLPHLCSSSSKGLDGRAVRSGQLNSLRTGEVCVSPPRYTPREGKVFARRGWKNVDNIQNPKGKRKMDAVASFVSLYLSLPPYMPREGTWRPFWADVVTYPRSTRPTRRRDRERSGRLPTRRRRDRRPTCSSSPPPMWPPGEV